MRIDQILLSICYFWITQLAWSQEIPNGISKNIIQYSHDSTFALVQKGKSTGLYDLINLNYAVEPSKSAKYLFKYSNDLMFCVNGSLSLASFTQGKFHVVQSSNDSTQESYTFKELKNGDVRVSIFDCGSYRAGDEYGYDDVPDYKNAVQASGIYSLKSQNWVVPNKYAKIYDYDGYIYGIHIDTFLLDPSLNWEMPVFTYDIYKEQSAGESYKLITSAASNQLEHLQAIYQWNDLDSSSEDLYHFIVKKDGKSGLIYDDLDQDYLHQGHHLEFEVLAPCEYDMVYNAGEKGIFTFKKGAQNELKLSEIKFDEGHYYLDPNMEGDKAVFFSIDPEFTCSELIKLTGDTTDIGGRIFNKDVLHYGQFGFQYVNDSLMKVIDVYPGDSYVLLDSWDYDSIDANGYAVYNRDGLRAKTGLYNYISDSWLVPPNYWDIHFSGDHFVVEDAKLAENKDDILQSYSVLNLDLSVRESDIDIQTFRSDPNFVKQLFLDDKYESVKKFGANTLSGDLSKGDYPIYECKLPNGKIDLVIPGVDILAPIVLVRDADFAIADPISCALMYIKNDTIHLKYKDSLISVPLENGAIEFTCIMRGYSDKFQISTRVSEDTVTFFGEPFERSWVDDYQCSLSMSFRNNELMVNHYPRAYNQYIDEVYYEPMGWTLDEFEYSAIWKKGDNGFELNSPYYASLKSVPNGYIAKTAERSGDVVINDQGSVEWDEYGNLAFENPKVPRYLLLDDKNKAVPFLDHYDFKLITDIGFGIQIETDKGAFFVSYEGKAITNDEWESFEIEDGKLKAYSSGLIRDEKGNPMVDEWGEPLYRKEPITEYFDL